MSSIQRVIKRDGSSELYHPFKIEDAIRKAYESVQLSVNEDVITKVLFQIVYKGIFEVEKIQDLIEEELHKSGAFSVMKSFITYRFLHKMQREHILGLDEDTTYVNSTQSVEEYIQKSDWRVNANANTGYSNAGLVNNLAGKVIANFWLDKVYAPHEGAAHRNGDIHIHDLDCLTGYCAGWSLRALLNEGFNGVRGRVESAPPRHLREALDKWRIF